MTDTHTHTYTHFIDAMSVFAVGYETYQNKCGCTQDNSHVKQKQSNSEIFKIFTSSELE